MCGIVGVISKSTNGFWKPQMDMFHELVYVDNFRGDDSTGIFMVDGDGDLEMIKEASSAPDFQRTKEYHELMRKAFQRGRCLIAHNRKATKGSIMDENAHPFVVDDRIVLVHNGTLYGDYQKHVPEGAKVEVDSHAIAHLIHKHDDNVEAAVQELQGAYTLVWFDMKLQTLNFVRNSQRPMAWMETHDAWIFASEKNMLDWMVIRHNLKPKQDPAELPSATLCTFSLEKGRWNVAHKEIQLTKPSAPPATSSYYPEYDSCDVGCGPVWPDPRIEEPDDGRLPLRNDIVELRKAIKERNVLTVFGGLAANHVDAANERRRHAAHGYVRRKEEEDFAYSGAANISQDRFLRCSEDFKDGERYAAECFEYSYVNDTDGAQGFFLYAWLNNSDNFMVRVHVPPEYPELTVQDFVQGRRAISLKIHGRAWRRFEDESLRNDDGDGFAIFFASDVKKILVLEKEKENA